jgi:hypothetical protein
MIIASLARMARESNQISVGITNSPLTVFLFPDQSSIPRHNPGSTLGQTRHTHTFLLLPTFVLIIYLSRLVLFTSQCGLQLPRYDLPRSWS